MEIKITKAELRELTRGNDVETGSFTISVSDNQTKINNHSSFTDYVFFRLDFIADQYNVEGAQRTIDVMLHGRPMNTLYTVVARYNNSMTIPYRFSIRGNGGESAKLTLRAKRGNRAKLNQVTPPQTNEADNG